MGRCGLELDGTTTFQLGESSRRDSSGAVFTKEEGMGVACLSRKGDRLLSQSQEVLLGGDQGSHGFMRDQ